MLLSRRILKVVPLNNNNCFVEYSVECTMIEVTPYDTITLKIMRDV